MKLLTDQIVIGVGTVAHKNITIVMLSKEFNYIFGISLFLF